MSNKPWLLKKIKNKTWVSVGYMDINLKKEKKLCGSNGHNWKYK